MSLARKVSVLLVLGAPVGWAGCQAGTRTASPPPSEGEAAGLAPLQGRIGSSIECVHAADCAATPSPCTVAVCEGGLCKESSEVLPGTRCELTKEQALLQTANPFEIEQAGVCWRGGCVPRMQCAEECGGDAAEKVAEMLAERMQDCQYRNGTPKALLACERSMAGRDAVRKTAVTLMTQCMIGCGYDEPEAPF
jgi:hypothetical protein